ncbi:hypothetical protein AGMMS50262_22730 [Bacteroidia bacterium]|nr:hypothetical protein AGMMS50262_22730 [Bacteroidia bacterium]
MLQIIGNHGHKLYSSKKGTSRAECTIFPRNAGDETGCIGECFRYCSTDRFYLGKKEKIDDETLRKIAEAMNIPVDAIKNFDEEKAINIVSNTFQDEVFNGGVVTQYNPTFNPIDKLVDLYDQIIKEKNERISFLEQLLTKQKT